MSLEVENRYGEKITNEERNNNKVERLNGTVRQRNNSDYRNRTWRYFNLGC